MTVKVFSSLLFSIIFIVGHSETLAEDFGDDYYIPPESFPDLFMRWFSGHDVEKLPQLEGDNVYEVANVEYKEIVTDVIDLINALKDLGLVIAEEVRIIKEIIHSKKL